MLIEPTILRIEDIYVPVKRRKTLNPEVVNEIAESMLEKGQLTSISVRRDGKRFVLVEGLHNWRRVRHSEKRRSWVSWFGLVGNKPNLKCSCTAPNP